MEHRRTGGCYACGKIIAGLLDGGGHRISRLKKNACAYAVPKGPGRPGRARPRRYGIKVVLRDLFPAPLTSMPSPIYDDRNVTLQHTCHDLLWRPAERLVRFVAVGHPQRGKILLLCTDLTLAPAQIIRLYALRFKNEVSFKQALHCVGTWAYHFWMRPMTPLRRFQGNQFLHRKSDSNRAAVRRKLDAYHRHIQIGLVAQGLLQCLAAAHPALVWRHFGSWLRTVRSLLCPSESVVACALRHTLPEFLSAPPHRLFLRVIPPPTPRSPAHRGNLPCRLTLAPVHVTGTLKYYQIELDTLYVLGVVHERRNPDYVREGLEETTG